MNDDFYSFISWKIKSLHHEEFLHTWEAEFAPAFLKLNPYSHITLIQSLDNPNIFYSFGPWIDLEQMQSARANVEYRSIISRLISLCDAAKPGSFKNVLTFSGNK